ncbi:MAG: citrate lyase holo-[acyl-carrier protein] synthase [Desulfuromonas sp.]|nr:MAG: citrate lyase holo-[acyl-carrier protein] synthase [Desulfuromonas sp.]
MMLLQSLNTVMDQSSIVSDALKRDLLDAREQRHWEVEQFVQAGHASVIQLATNLPGPDKAPPGCSALLEWARYQLEESLQAQTVVHSRDRAGYYCLLISAQDPLRCKQVGIDLEHAQPFARLLDVDVYGPYSGQLSRQSLGYPARPCLICGASAVECIRSDRHDQDAVIRAAHAHLRNFTRRSTDAGLYIGGTS